MTAPQTELRLSLGPVSYYWSRDDIFSFYTGIAETPVDIVYLGETVCSKRRNLRLDDWFELAELLQQAGKEVVLSSLTLLEAGSELSAMRTLCDNRRFMVEANDMSAVQLLSGNADFVTGPAVNIYNARTLSVLAKHGLKRWVLPVELSGVTLADIQQQRPQGVETEVFAYGRLPLAYSARCFTARKHNLPKDDCQFRCLDYPDGLLLKTREKTPFLVLNGIQTQSAHTHNLVGYIDELADADVDVLRISPQSQHTEQIIDCFHDCLQHKLSADDAEAQLQELMPTSQCNGFWHGKPGLDNSLRDEPLKII